MARAKTSARRSAARKPVAKKSRAKPLPIETAIKRLGAMVDLIERELRTAIQLERSLETANDIVKAELHGHSFYGAECYDTVKLATQLYLAIVLARLVSLEIADRRPG